MTTTVVGEKSGSTPEQMAGPEDRVLLHVLNYESMTCGKGRHKVLTLGVPNPYLTRYLMATISYNCLAWLVKLLPNN